MKTIRHAERGFSLIEIMVALTISLILLAGVLTIMSSSKRTYLLQDELGQLQENARFVMNDITTNFRMAGYYGCSNTPPADTPVVPPVDGINNSKILVAKRNTNGEYLVDPDLKAGSSPEYADKNEPPSDILEISTFGRPISFAAPIKDNPNRFSSDLCEVPNKDNKTQLGESGNSTFYLPNEISLGDSIILSDCGGSKIYKVASRSGDEVTVENTFQRNYRCPVELYNSARAGTGQIIRYEVRAIDKGGNANSATDPIDGFALFRTDSKDPDGKMRLLVDGVENLQVRLGIDTDPEPPRVADKFIELPSNDSDEPAGDVVSVRITLLMRTPNFQGSILDITDPDAYAFVLDPALYPADDPYKPMKEPNLANEEGYRHRVFTTTIQVRN